MDGQYGTTNYGTLCYVTGSVTRIIFLHEYILYEDHCFAKLNLLTTKHDHVCELACVILDRRYSTKARGGRHGLSIELKMGGSLSFTPNPLFCLLYALASRNMERLPA